MRPGSSAQIDVSTGNPVVTEPPLAFIATAIEAIRSGRIRYCYWRSRRKLPLVLAGESDVDLLIAPEDRDLALQILLKHGFKPFDSHDGAEHPAIKTLLGLDSESGRIVHLHLHFRLIVGEVGYRAFRLPWETILLRRALEHPTLQIALLDVAAEALLLVVRQALEVRVLDPAQWRHWRRRAIEAELDKQYLASIVDTRELYDLARRFLPDGVAAAIAALYDDSRKLSDHPGLFHLIRCHLAVHRTCSATAARVRGWKNFLNTCAGRLKQVAVGAGGPYRRWPQSGGSLIVILGVDGSGKSTAIREIRRWLEPKMDILPVYFGTGDGRATLFLWPFKIILPVFTSLMRGRQAGLIRSRQDGPTPPKRPSRLHTLLLATWATAVALDKRSKLKSAWRGVNRGLIVVTDRFPQNQLPQFNDGPLLTNLPSLSHSLREFEGDIYARADMQPPDLVIKLIASPETLAKREPEMSLNVILERIELIKRLSFPTSRVVIVDADQPLAGVLKRLKAEIWRQI